MPTISFLKNKEVNKYERFGFDLYHRKSMAA